MQFNPILFLRLPYRLIFAIATENSLYLYDTQHLMPFAYLTGIHYSNLTDLSWSNNGSVLCVSSIDGFCTFVRFDTNELGEQYVECVKTTDANEAKIEPTSKQAPNKFQTAPNKPVAATNTIPTLFSSKNKKTITLTRIEPL
jgi:chromatin assembly factor 1 subunit B